jgi:hypothetical protein
MIPSAIPLATEDNRRFSIRLKVYGLPYNLDLRKLVNCVLAFMKTLTRTGGMQLRTFMLE